MPGHRPNAEADGDTDAQADGDTDAQAHCQADRNADTKANAQRATDRHAVWLKSDTHNACIAERLKSHAYDAYDAYDASHADGARNTNRRRLAASADTTADGRFVDTAA